MFIFNPIPNYASTRIFVLDYPNFKNDSNKDQFIFLVHIMNIAYN